MIELPFHAKMTDGFAALLRRITAEHRRDNPDALPSITWCRFESGARAGTSNWSLQSFSLQFMNAEDVFTIGEISVHVAGDVHRLAGRVLVWIENEGLVAPDDTA